LKNLAPAFLDDDIRHRLRHALALGNRHAITVVAAFSDLDQLRVGEFRRLFEHRPGDRNGCVAGHLEGERFRCPLHRRQLLRHFRAHALGQLVENTSDHVAEQRVFIVGRRLLNGIERLRDREHQGAAIVGGGGNAERLDAGEGLHSRPRWILIAFVVDGFKPAKTRIQLIRINKHTSRSDKVNTLVTAAFRT
jgi:hypothetical protein